MTSVEGFGSLAPDWLDRLILAATCHLPNNWLGLRLAIPLRRVVMIRLSYPDGALDVVRWAMRLRLHPRDNGCEKKLLFTPQMYETTELDELEIDIARARQKQVPFVFVDIGANVGLFSLFVAAKSGGAARILAIEPEPGNLARLRFNIRANGNVPIKVLPVALDNVVGEVAIEVDRRDRGGSSVRQIEQVKMTGDVVRVPSRTLTEVIVAENIYAIDALKIDVEGMEDLILCPFFQEVAPRLWPRLLIVEDSRSSWKADLMSLLTVSGYTLAARSRQNLVMRRASIEDQGLGSVISYYWSR
jgi:FkbM family methyltransferase